MMTKMDNYISMYMRSISNGPCSSSLKTSLAQLKMSSPILAQPFLLHAINSVLICLFFPSDFFHVLGHYNCIMFLRLF